MSYKVFEHTAKGNVNIEINNSATTRLPAIEINAAADNYICATPTEATVIADPESYTGWVDPNKPVHVPSGIYLRGEVNSWSPVEEWEFSDLGNGEYILYDKTLSGAFKVADASWSSACNYGSNGTNIFPDTPMPSNQAPTTIFPAEATFTPPLKFASLSPTAPPRF